MRHIFIASAVCAIVSTIGCAGPTNLGSYYVTAPTLKVRLAPNGGGKITNRLHRQERVDVLEVRNGWARISRYYDGRTEGLSGDVARWVSLNHLSKQRSAGIARAKIPHDPRLNGIPEVGTGGLTERDVLILHRAARHFLDSGRCKRIEYGDKSVSKANTYYVNCGGPRNLFFTPSDLPWG